MSGVGESRSELLSWVNDLLKLNYTKVEQCGTGAAYCQIVDSIYRDLPMHRVRFNSTVEYEFITNYKILQSAFTKHKVEKTVYVEKLVKCRFQDNLEFLQWLKKFWVQNKDESDYDAESRRKSRASPASTPAGVASSNISVTKRRTTPVPRVSSGTASTRGVGSVGSRSGSASYLSSRKASNEQLLSVQTELSQAQANNENLVNELKQYKEAISILERERDFYFGKLRDIEILSQSTKDLCKEGVYENSSDELDRFLDKIQKILYATEEGFEVASEEVKPTATNGHGGDVSQAGILSTEETVDLQPHARHNLITDEETF
ncbi:LAMI_0A06986g1_1 [Lachancea mirantina]|uniref:LAMI_0A06986g1_1 n=1 Tax=Lachancea mirantina TaxID=1230905 RepID=A0A1G4IQL6_9SACH|nr:LAMI_0A06986g1_1 [Lachancea mirantina]